jgi:hypothetical protein
VTMAKSRKYGDWVDLLVGLLGVLVLLGLTPLRVPQTISAIGFIAICLLSPALAALITIGGCRFANRSRGRPVAERNRDGKALDTVKPGRVDSAV